MNHKQLMSQLENCKNNFILTMAGLAVIIDPGGKDILRKSHCKFDGFSINFDQVATLLEDPADAQIAVTEAVLSPFRALLKESFELVKTYANSNNQKPKFQNFPSYRFHRLLRNAISHNFCWDLQTRGNFYGYLPLNWRGIVIDRSMHNQPVRREHLPFGAMWQLYVDLETEARISLS